MNRRLVNTITCTVLVIVLSLSMISDTFAATWLFYDDGPELDICHKPDHYFAVRFSLPDGWSRAKIVKISYYISSKSNLESFNAYIFDSDGSTILLGPLVVTPTSRGNWFIVDVSSYDISISGDFYVAMQYIVNCQPITSLDTTDPDSRSYIGDTLPLTGPYTDLDILIRAEVDPGRIRVPSSVVGGFCIPTNSFNVLWPYFALIDLVCIVSAILIKGKRRKS